MHSNLQRICTQANGLYTYVAMMYNAQVSSVPMSHLVPTLSINTFTLAVSETHQRREQTMTDMLGVNDTDC